MFDYDAIVIGAGCEGITAASLLAKQGRKEQAKSLGRQLPEMAGRTMI